MFLVIDVILICSFIESLREYYFVMQSILNSTIVFNQFSLLLFISSLNQMVLFLHTISKKIERTKAVYH